MNRINQLVTQIKGLRVSTLKLLLVTAALMQSGGLKSEISIILFHMYRYI